MNAYLPLNMIQDVLNEDISIKALDSVIKDIVNDSHFESSEKEIETYNSIDDLKYPQDYDEGIITLDDLNEKEMNDPGVQAFSKRSRHNNLSIFIFSQNYYELPKGQ